MIILNFFLPFSLYFLAGGGGGYSGGDTFKSSVNGEGGTSYIGKKRSITELSAIYAGDNIGHGSVVIVPAIPHPACGCDYRCVVLDEFSVNVRCICPDGWRLKKDNQTACERKCFCILYQRQTHQFVLLILLKHVTCNRFTKSEKKNSLLFRFFSPSRPSSYVSK